jgi:hypothetical protein
MVTHFDATLGMGGWLDLTQQGLSPCKKYKISWRSPPLEVTGLLTWHPLTKLYQKIPSCKERLLIKKIQGKAYINFPLG